ncbi:MAG: Gfo/Idh/MocA family oxidoreductase [Clostridia bacterium]|nr:Gfo/Idh/MocA family oxidoreductase [Clostridia bacterium]
MEKIKIGIIGVGNMGSSHAKNIAIKGLCPDLELVAVADLNADRRAWAKEELPGITVFETAEEMLDSGLLDSCIVAVPHYDHPRFAKACFDRNIHVMVEKPAGVYTKQVREMNEAAAKSDVVFGMMFNQRTNPMYIKMREIMQSGELGQLRRCNWLITNWFRSQYYYDSGDWRATWSGEGGGVLLNQCPHNLDLWQWICGMPVSVDVKMHFGKWHDIEVEDDVVAYVEYENGAIGTFITTTADCPGSNRFEVVCEKGTMIADNVEKTLTIIRLDESLGEFTGYNCPKGAFGAPAKEKEIITFDTSGPAHPAILNAFADAINGKGDLIARGEEGINGLTLSNAMHLSAFTGKTVQLPLDEDLFYEELMKRVATSRKKEAVQTSVSDTSGSY